MVAELRRLLSDGYGPPLFGRAPEAAQAALVRLAHLVGATRPAAFARTA